jgi:dephospho-CoA kinase
MSAVVIEMDPHKRSATIEVMTAEETQLQRLARRSERDGTPG